MWKYLRDHVPIIFNICGALFPPPPFFVLIHKNIIKTLLEIHLNKNLSPKNWVLGFFWKIKWKYEKSNFENFINTFCFQMSQNLVQTKFIAICTIREHQIRNESKNGTFWPFSVFFKRGQSTWGRTTLNPFSHQI